jgi:hypothetical protein
MISNKLKAKKTLSKLWNWKTKTLLVGAGLIVSWFPYLNKTLL